jgi:hypothetical protein
MKIIQVTSNKKQYISLLLLADEQENMIDTDNYDQDVYHIQK